MFFEDVCNISNVARQVRGDLVVALNKLHSKIAQFDAVTIQPYRSASLTRNSPLPLGPP